MAETAEVAGLSRSTLNREWNDPRSTFPRPRRSGKRRVHLLAVEVLAFLEAGAATGSTPSTRKGKGAA